jgi:nitrite reductase/ring-hydroxylating ferredoxin subunit
VGAWTSAALVDVVALGLPPGERRAGADRAAQALLGIGLAAAPVTAAAGITDWSKLLPEQQRVGLVHASANTVALGLLTASLVQRRRGRPAGRLLGLLGFAVASAGAGIGGHLSYRWAAGANHAQDVPHVTPSEWAELGALEEFEQRTPILRHVGDTPVVVVRRGSTFTVFADHCSHLSGPLHEGRLVDVGGDDCIVCPWHGSTFLLEDGSVRHGPATAPQPGFDVQVRDGVVRARVRPPA